jgi:hypothetical protein
VNVFGDVGSRVSSRLRRPMADRPKRNWWDRNLTVAVIAAVAAIAGAGVGAFATYYGNRSLQRDQSRATVRGIARVLSSQFMNAEPRLEVALREDRLILPEPTEVVVVNTGDEELLASSLSSAAWTEVANTLSSLALERQALSPGAGNWDALEAKAGRRVSLSTPLRSLDQSLLRGLRRSVDALKSLSDG